VKHRGIQNQNMAGVDGVLQKINVEVLPLEYIYFKPIQLQYFETSSEHVNHFYISILDEIFEQIDFQGGTWIIGFTVHFNYNKEVILDDEIKSLLKNEEELEKEKKEKIKELRKEIVEKQKNIKKKS
jgi:hypothetical protein